MRKRGYKERSLLAGMECLVPDIHYKSGVQRAKPFAGGRGCPPMCSPLLLGVGIHLADSEF